MSRHRNSIAPQITEEACHWFVLMREPEVSAEDREAFAEWLRASPMHVGAYLEITRLWSDAAQIGQDTKVDLTEDLSNVVPFREGGDRSHLPADDLDTSGSNGKLGAKKRSAKWMPMAASIVGACVMAGGACWLATRPPTYQTDVGEQRVITLEDQSIVRLNSRSKLQVRLLPSLREVRLLEGQALFEVAHDSARPFIVRSGDVAVRAVGTQFDVNRRESGTVVTVVEGRVKVNTVPASPISQFVLPGQTDKRTSSSDQASVFVSAGEQVRVAQGGALERKAHADTVAATSWLQHELRFDGQPLRDVLEEFNRYSRTPIVLRDPSLGDFRINAVFHSTNPDSLLRFLARVDGVQVEKSEEEIRISISR